MTPIIGKGDTVRWRSDVSKDRTPMVVYERHGAAVRVDGPAGSIVSIGLLELVEASQAEMAKVIEAQAGAIDTGFKILDHMIAPPPADDGLMAVIEAQMEGLGELQGKLTIATQQLEYAQSEIASLEAYNAGSDEGFREEVERMLGNVCLALGFPREPLQKTGIPELDALVRYVATA